MNDKKYSLSNNVFFLLRMIRKYLPMSFVFVIIDIPLAVFLDYVGVRIPNLIVGMIQGYSVSVGIIVAFGIASVVAAVILQYGNRMVSAQAPQLCAKLDLKLFEKYMTCSYEKLEDADFTAHYKEADGYLADDNHFLSEAAMHIIEIGSGALGIILYFSILYRCYHCPAAFPDSCIFRNVFTGYPAENPVSFLRSHGSRTDIRCLSPVVLRKH